MQMKALCTVCGKPAKYQFTPDMDMQGLLACKKHEEDVRILYGMLFRGSKKDYEDYMKDLKSKNK